MIIKYPSLAGHVEIKDGEIIPHGDPSTKYMQSLLDRAENWKQAWDKADKPDIEYLSDKAREIVETIEINHHALHNFSLRIKKQIETGLDRDHAIELWENLTKNREAAVYLFEQQMYEILREENV